MAWPDVFINSSRRWTVFVQEKIPYRGAAGAAALIAATLIILSLACGGQKEEAGREVQTAGEKTAREEGAVPPEAQQTQAVQAYGQLPLSFTENAGQVDEPVRFYLRGSRGTVYFTPQEVVYDVVEQTTRSERPRPGEEPEEARPDTTVRRRGVVVRMKLEDANPDLTLEGVDQLQGKVNIFRGKDPNQWKTNIRTFGGIVYRNLYPGINLAYYGKKGRLAPRLTIRPGGQFDEIAFRYEGADSLYVDDQGQLRIVTDLGTITEPAPDCYQERGEGRMAVEGRYRLSGNHTVGFHIGRWDRSRPLIISLADGD
jgi:hypothetical protein